MQSRFVTKAPRPSLGGRFFDISAVFHAKRLDEFWQRCYLPTDMNTHPTKPEEAKPTRRRIVKRVEPFSPWQVLIQDRCTELGLSSRALAAKIATKRREYEHTTVWAWLRSPEGAPPGNTYTQDLNRRLAAAIGVSPDVLAEAFEESRRKFMITSNPTQQGPLTVLRMLFAESKRESWKTAEILKIIDDIRGN